MTDWTAEGLKLRYPWVRLDVKVPLDAIMTELQSSPISPATQDVRGAEGWGGFVLHGLGPDKPRPHTHYGFDSEERAPYSWTELARQMPETTRWIQEQFPSSRYARVKINLMKPGGSLGPHRDTSRRTLGATNPSSGKVQYISVPLQWPSGVSYLLGGYEVPIKAGDCYLMDFSRIHAVYNNSSADRHLLIIAGEFRNSAIVAKLVEDGASAPQEGVRRIPFLNRFLFYVKGYSRVLASTLLRRSNPPHD